MIFWLKKTFTKINLVETYTFSTICKKAFNHLIKYGFFSFIKRGLEYIFCAKQNPSKLEINQHIMILPIIAKEGSEHCSPSKNIKTDVILPVFNSFLDTKLCIQSVLSNSQNCRLIIIDDGSTDPMLKVFLDDLLQKSNLNDKIEISIIRHNINKGFVASVNEGIQMGSRNVVILNSDTLVPPSWLERLLAPIWNREDEVASVTPFSNSATICSFPEICKKNDLLNNLSFEVIDEYFKKYGASEPIEIPTGVGFCMALNRKTLNKIGLFDENTFGRGYGEENDWSLRAKKAGFKNLMITNLFVYHRDGGSFSNDEKTRLLHENVSKVERKHKGYNKMIKDFIRSDPVWGIRESLVLVIDCLTRKDSKLVVVFDHGLGGGAKVYGDFLIKILRRDRLRVIVVRYHFSSNNYTLHYESEFLTKEFCVRPTSATMITSVLTLLEPSLVLINSVVSWPNPLEVCSAIKELSIPYIVFMHDFFYLCPNWNLLGIDKKFCKLPDDIETCQKCLYTNKFADYSKTYEDQHIDLDEWQNSMKDFLQRAFSVICFSNDTVDWFNKRFFSTRNFSIVEHALITKSHYYHWKPRDFQSNELMIGIIGAIGFHKGFGILEQLIFSSEFESLPVKIVLIGKTIKFQAGRSYNSGRLYVHGNYTSEELPRLLDSYGVNVVFIPSVWPETFSFTTSEAIVLGYPVICFNIGAPAERIRQNECGIIVKNISVNDIIQTLTKILKEPQILMALSENTRRYRPPSVRQHSKVILGLIDKALRM